MAPGELHAAALRQRRLGRHERAAAAPAQRDQMAALRQRRQRLPQGRAGDPERSASSRSGGRRSPGPSSPRRIAVPRRSTLLEGRRRLHGIENRRNSRGENPHRRRDAQARRPVRASLPSRDRGCPARAGAAAPGGRVRARAARRRKNEPQLPRERLGGRDTFVRLPGKDTELLGIDREAERAATQPRPRSALRPRSSRSRPSHRCLVTAFIEA